MKTRPIAPVSLRFLEVSATGSPWATSAAAAVAAVFVIAPVTGQDGPPPGGKGGGGFGGKGGGKQAVPAGPVPRTAEGKPDMSGFWGGVNPGGNVSIEPQAKGGGKGAPKGGPPGGGPPGGGPPGGPGAGKGPGGPPLAGGPGGPPLGGGGPPPGGGPPAGGGPPGGGRGPAANAIIDPPDGKVPYNAAARAKSDDLIANGMFHEPELHCFMSSVPHNMWSRSGQQTLQTKDYIVFNWEFMHSRRIIPLDNRPHQITNPAVKLFQGESVGHWEGDTLVVDTTNQNDKTWFDTSGHYKPEDVHVVERFTMTDSNTIEYEADIDSKEFTQTMKVKGRRRVPTPTIRIMSRWSSPASKAMPICSTTLKTRAAKLKTSAPGNSR